MWSDIIDEGLLDESYLNYRQKYFATWDCEALETGESRSVTPYRTEEGTQSLISIACSNNINGETRCFVRKNSSLQAGIDLVEQFLEILEEWQSLLEEEIDPEIHQAIDRCEQLIETTTFSVRKTKLKKMLNFLKNQTKLVVFGFNSGKSSIII